MTVWIEEFGSSVKKLPHCAISISDEDKPLEMSGVGPEAPAGQEQMEVETTLEPEKAPSLPPPPPVPPGQWLHQMKM